MNNLKPQQWLETLPKGTKMSILGPPKTFTEKAAKLLIGTADNVDVEYQDSMWDIHDAVNHDGHLGLLPYTNYSSGHEPDNLDALFTEEWKIMAEAMLRVQMVLGGPGVKNYDAVTDVYSKDVGLRQCSAFVRKYLPNAKRHATNSTVEAIKEVAESGNEGAVAIGPKAAHQRYGNIIWDEGISNAEMNGEENVTHFMVVTRSDTERALVSGYDHHGLILTPKDEDGVTGIATNAMAKAGMGLYSQPERPIGLMKYRFLYLMDDHEKKHRSTDRMIDTLHKDLEAANGIYPLVQPISSWNTRVYDKGLQPDTVCALSVDQMSSLVAELCKATKCHDAHGASSLLIGGTDYAGTDKKNLEIRNAIIADYTLVPIHKRAGMSRDILRLHQKYVQK